MFTFSKDIFLKICSFLNRNDLVELILSKVATNVNIMEQMLIIDISAWHLDNLHFVIKCELLGNLCINRSAIKCIYYDHIQVRNKHNLVADSYNYIAKYGDMYIHGVYKNRYLEEHRSLYDIIITSMKRYRTIYQLLQHVKLCKYDLSL